MEYKAQFNQKDLLLKVNQHYDKSVIDMYRWEEYLDVLCGVREYQKEAIRNAIIYLASGMYNSIEDLVKENYGRNTELQRKYGTVDAYLKQLQITDKLFGNIDLATGTGKSYVIYAIAQIMLAEGIVKRVLVLCPSVTIEKGLVKKFEDLASRKDLRDALPEGADLYIPRIINANSTIKNLDICVENIHAVYETTGSSIKDSFKNGGEDTLVLNDESHHIFNKTIEKGNSGSNIKKWKSFLLNPEYNFKYILGFTGTAYIENEYFNDVIYRYSLRQAIDDRVVKSIDYVQKDDGGANRDYKFQKILKNHLDNKHKYTLIKPLTILVTRDIKSAENLYEDVVDFLCMHEGSDLETAKKKVLIVTSDPAHKANVAMLDYVDDKNNAVEWIVSVSMLTEGWDVKNVFQIVPWEDRAFNSKLLISQVLGRGLRIPQEYANPQPIVTVFNHDNWSKNITALVNEVLEIEKKIVSTVKFVGDRNKYNFELKNLSYERVEEETELDTIGSTLDYSAVWNDGITLKSQILSSHNDTEYENLVNGLKHTISYDIKLRTRSIDDVIDKIYREFRLRDWETSLLGLGDDEVYSKDNLPPRDKLEKIIRLSMDKAGITGDLLIEDNANKIFAAFSTLFRARSKTVVNKIKSTEFETIKTVDMRDESRGVSSFRSDASLFYSSDYETEISEDDQKKIIDEFFGDESFPIKAHTEVNVYDFKTPLNFVIATANPEYTFIKKYLIKNANAQKIKAWIKSRDVGFYSIEYSYKIGSHTKQGSFNPDFIIKLNDEKDIYVVLEIKDNGDDSLENKGKNRAALAHFELLNSKLKETGSDEKYYFHFISPDDYEVFFEYLRNNMLDSFVSGLDTLLNE